MPELPEVETLRRGMERLALDDPIVKVHVLTTKILKPPIDGPEEFAAGLISRRFVNARRRGKHLIFGLDSGYALYAHLKMRGQMVLALAKNGAPEKYLCLVITMMSGAELRYYDMWKWGEFRLVKDDLGEIVKFVPALATMGPEPLDNGFNGQVLKARGAAKSGSAVKIALLDQSFVAGVGNIYGDEALYRSRISPLRKTSTLTDREWEALAAEIRAVLTEAVSAGGTLSDNYVDIEGVAGRYRPAVYGRAKEPCLECGEALAGCRLGGRSSVYCTNCQR